MSSMVGNKLNITISKWFFTHKNKIPVVFLTCIISQELFFSFLYTCIITSGRHVLFKKTGLHGLINMQSGHLRTKHSIRTEYIISTNELLLPGIIIYRHAEREER